MIGRRRAARLAWTGVVLLAAVLLTSSCGVKAPPLPAEASLPDRVVGLAYGFTEEGRLTVTFNPPEKNVRGLPLKDLAGFFVDRSENLLRPGFCVGCPVTYTQRMRLPAKKPPPLKDVARVQYSYQDRLEPGRAYHYRIMAYNGGERFDPTRAASLAIVYDHPSRSPEGLKARAEDRMVFLNWSPPNRLLDGRPLEDLAGYDVYRRSEGGVWVKVNAGGPWKRSSYGDAQVENGRAYEYKVRAVRELQGTLIAGPASETVLARPFDLTPPPPPVKVFFASVREGVKLTWTDVQAADLAGYRVYRRLAGQVDFRRIGPALVFQNLFLDESVRRGGVYYYRITSVDGSPSANESEPSPEIMVHFEP
ncbi:MAG: hypothetical protein AB1641_18110 [Thermodesulfobacteriota bacterium]